MNLLLDAGNSRVKWGIRQSGAWLARGVCPTRDVASLAGALAPLDIRRALACCVADAATRALLEDMLSPRVERLRWLTARAEAHGVTNRYQPPESLGADRYAALVAAWRRQLGDCVVASVGTALTADALTAAGEFLGGAIAPGPELMRAALLRGTAGVREYDDVEKTAFPVDTGAAVASGVTLAMVGVVLGMRERLMRWTGGPVTLLLAGGARSWLAGVLPAPLVEAEDLVLEGLAGIAKEWEWDV